MPVDLLHLKQDSSSIGNPNPRNWDLMTIIHDGYRVLVLGVGVSPTPLITIGPWLSAETSSGKLPPGTPHGWGTGEVLAQVAVVPIASQLDRSHAITMPLSHVSGSKPQSPPEI